MMNDIQLQAGTVLLNKYRIEGKIGQGGLGAVYKATELRLNRLVAIKTLRHDQTTLDQRYGQGTYAEYLNRFEREAQVSSYFTGNPAIITVHGLEQDADGSYYLILEYLERGNLTSLLRERGRLPVEQAVHITLDMCEALAEIHFHPMDIIHRDLKPSDILLRTNGHAVIADFGIAQVGHESQRSLMIANNYHPGSPAYMSPEQQNNPNIYLTPSSDLYSVGLILYEMLVGQSYARLKRLPVSLENPQVPPWLDKIIGRLLEPDPLTRYERAQQVIDDLQAGLQSKSATHPSPEITSTNGSSGGWVSTEQAQAHEIAETTLPISGAISKTTPSFTPALVNKTARIFISYQPKVEPDQTVVDQIVEALGQRYQVFADQETMAGLGWAKRIGLELEQADWVIVFLSAQSARSEMLADEVGRAHQLSKTHGGKPNILPVRLNYAKAWQYPLSVYLDSVKEVRWQDAQDTAGLIEIIQGTINRGELVPNKREATPTPLPISEPSPVPYPLAAAQPISLEMPEGTMDAQSAFYVVRSSDRIALEAIKRQGVTITIKGPRQMGKSSLLIRTVEAANRLGKRTAFLDFQLFDKAALVSADTFFPQFCAWLSDELDLESQVDEYWSNPLGNNQRCTRYLGRYILKELGGPLVLAMDEVESIFDSDFRSDFFSMLRNWHNSRATTPLWKQLDLVLVTSTEPYQLIENLNQSPFNVGEVIELADFTPDQVLELNRQHNNPLDEAGVQQLMDLLSGHPYLVRRGLYLVASQRLSAEELFLNATDDRGPFGDHLRNHLFRLSNKPELIAGLREVLYQNTCDDERVFFRLKGAGLVRRDGKGRTVVPRCQLYAEYFKAHLKQ